MSSKRSKQARLRRPTKRLDVMVLMHPDLIPQVNADQLPATEFAEIKTEYHVINALEQLGHNVLKLGIRHELTPLRQAIQERSPDIAFNLLAEFQDQSGKDQAVISYLELMGVPYTGCNPRGLMVARDKALTKKVLTYHNVMTAEFRVFPRDRKVRTPAGLKFPMIVKSLSEEASVGLSQSSVVTSPEKLRERVEFVHEHVETDAIVEEYVEGREITLSLMGTERLQAFPTWELDISGLPDTAQRIATYKVKWDLKYQKRHGVRLKRAEGLSEHEEAHIAGTAKRIYRALGLSGYARMDFRLTPDHELYFLEANPNPDIAQDEEFASSAEAVGLTYPALIQRILNLGLRDSSGLRAAS